MVLLVYLEFLTPDIRRSFKQELFLSIAIVSFIVRRGEACKVNFVLLMTLQSNSLPCTHNYSFKDSRQNFRVESEASGIGICKLVINPE